MVTCPARVQRCWDNKDPLGAFNRVWLSLARPPPRSTDVEELSLGSVWQSAWGPGSHGGLTANACRVNVSKLTKYIVVWWFMPFGGWFILLRYRLPWYILIRLLRFHLNYIVSRCYLTLMLIIAQSLDPTPWAGEEVRRLGPTDYLTVFFWWWQSFPWINRLAVGLGSYYLYYVGPITVLELHGQIIIQTK